MPLWQHKSENLTSLISVKLHMPACFLESITAQTETLIDINDKTLMAGLSCGEVSQLAWELLKPALLHYLSIDDAAVAPLMARFADGTIGGVEIEAGECATSGLAALFAAKPDPQYWQNLGFNACSVILLIGSEGAIDADLHTQLTSLG